jgi:hypothetical protein
MERADNSLDLARARELLKAAQWDLEKVCRRIYGQDVQADQLGKVNIVLNIGQQRSEPLDVVGEEISSPK